MSSLTDGWFLLGLSAAGYLCAHVVHRQLTAIREITEVKNEEGSNPNKINQRTQNAIKLDTLDHLLQSASPEIRWASVKILTERNIQSGSVWKILRRDVAGKDFVRRDKALASMNFLTSYFRPNLQEDPHFRDFETFKAMVKCLVNMLPAAREAESAGHHHSPAEADALWIMQQLLETSVSAALRAGLIKKWLSQYPLQTKRPNEEKKDIIRDMVQEFEYNDDYERFLCCVLREITQFTSARLEMKEHGIGDPGEFDVGSTFADNSRWLARRDQIPTYMEMPTYMERSDDPRLDTDDEGVLIATVDGGPRSPSTFGNPTGPLRRREESHEERSLRRRRREAMVYAENGRPIQREDIIEREYVVRDEDVEEELEQLIEEAAGEHAIDQSSSWWSWLSRIRPDGLAPP